MRVEVYKQGKGGVYQRCKRHSLPALTEAATALAYAGYTVYSTEHDRPQSDTDRHWAYFSHRHSMTARLPLPGLSDKLPFYQHHAVNGNLTMTVSSSTVPYAESKHRRADGEAVYEISFDHESRREYGRGSIHRLGGIPALVESANVVLRGHAISDSCPVLREDVPPVEGKTAAELRAWLRKERSVYSKARREADAKEAETTPSRWETLKVLLAGASR